MPLLKECQQKFASSFRWVSNCTIILNNKFAWAPNLLEGYAMCIRLYTLFITYLLFTWDREKFLTWIFELQRTLSFEILSSFSCGGFLYHCFIRIAQNVNIKTFHPLRERIDYSLPLIRRQLTMGLLSVYLPECQPKLLISRVPGSGFIVPNLTWMNFFPTSPFACNLPFRTIPSISL